MVTSGLKRDGKVERIEWALLKGVRSRPAGGNARLGVHGKEVPMDIVRITIEGVTGFGWSRISKENAKQLVGSTVSDLFTTEGKVKPSYYAIEFPLLDWLGKYIKKPVYQLFLDSSVDEYSVPCYDTSLYFDDLHLESDEDAVELIQMEALEGVKKGHRHFKIKVGRGAMHMQLEKGKKRDIAIIRGVREVLGPDSKIMIDANNGYNLNLTKEVLTETADANLTWIEEPFHEDPEYLSELKSWLEKQNLNIMVVDGEGNADVNIVRWAKDGLLDAIQYDIRQYGFHKWLELGEELDKANVHTAPHNYGGSYGNFALMHLAPNINGFLFVEWDGMDIQGIDDSAYVIKEGEVSVPNSPGFGLNLDDDYYTNLLNNNGWHVEWNHKQRI